MNAFFGGWGEDKNKRREEKNASQEYLRDKVLMHNRERRNEN